MNELKKLDGKKINYLHPKFQMKKVFNTNNRD